MGLILIGIRSILYTPLLGVNSPGKRVAGPAVKFRFRYLYPLSVGARDLLERRSKYVGFIQVTPHEQRYKKGNVGKEAIC